MITADEVMRLLLVAAPSSAGIWDESGSDPTDDVEDRLHYVDASAFARHLVGQLQAGATGELSAAFDAIERLHLEGDDGVRELATIGYLEGLQSAASRAGVEASEIEAYLGPESLRWWRGLDVFWSGGAPVVRPQD
ncbi:hypothetical protein ASE01_19505 [Nocardioides sp. Root190]|uniref:DUF7674 family protein n=1 Tax=Nocardioides sp. Root190 TaxID=1736488 RepID=UPI0006F398CF|nr:hypothetical protein [Nocardioides sp. Root190]KRB74160.1 hypothetical protein ASE01_19505 [Nocardioides sp. Root190]